VTVPGEDGPRHVRLDRVTQVLLEAPGFTLSTVLLQDDRTFAVLHRKVPEAVVHQAIEDSAGRLPTDWEKWEGDARVSLALPIDQALDAGRFYAFLPMGPSAVPPVPALLDAPFFPDVDRKDLEASVPLNDMWIRELCAHAADVVVAAAAGHVELPLPLCVDLLCWDAPRLQQLADELDARDAALDALPVLPTTTGSASSLDSAWIWPGADASEFGAAAVSNCGAADILDVQTLGANRTRRLRALAVRRELPLDPQPEHLADFAEDVAAHLLTEQASLDRWAAFYDDLAQHQALGAACSNKRILLTADVVLRAAEDVDGSSVFFAPTAEDAGTTPTDVPDGVRSRLAFMPRDLPTRAAGAAGRNRPGRTWLVTSGLVLQPHLWWHVVGGVVGSFCAGLVASSPG